MATNDLIKSLGAQKTLEANGGATSDNAVSQADDASLTGEDIGGMPVAIFEFETAASSPFSGTPTSGAAIHLYERKFMTGGSNQGPAPAATYRHDYIGSFWVQPNNAQQFLRIEDVPINTLGGDYYIGWNDGGAGTVSLSAGWALKVTPYTSAPSA